MVEEVIEELIPKSATKPIEELGKPETGKDYLRPLVRFFRGEVTAKQLDDIDKLVGKEGFCAASVELLKVLNINLKSVVPEESKEVLSGENVAVILYSNHERTIEPVVVFAAVQEIAPSLERKQQIRGIGRDYVTFGRENIAEKIYPIVANPETGLKPKNPYEFFWEMVVKILQQKRYPFFVAARKNLSAIKNAAQHLSRGNIIFTTPFFRREKWGKGIGYLAKNAQTESPVFAIPILVGGASRKPMVEAIFRRPSKPTEVTAKFGSPLELKKQEREEKSATTLTKMLKEHYDSQFPPQ